jgi:predicted glycosyltransferase
MKKKGKRNFLINNDGNRKNILFDIGHPAHVHLFKNFIIYLKKEGHNVVVASREKDVANILLKHYGIDFISISKCGKGLVQMFGELLKRDYMVFRFHKRFKFDLAFGTSVSIAHLSALSKAKSFIFEEDDDAVVPLFSKITYPFATGIIVPNCLKYKRWKKKRIVHNSYHELAYLHPKNFKPDVKVLKKYNLRPHEYILVRKSALKAHHDYNVKGLKGEIWDKIYKIIRDYKIINIIENKNNSGVAPWEVHDMMSFAKMVISDSQTMIAEAAVLGVPSIRYNSFVGRISYLEELEKKYHLTFGFRPGEEESVERKVKELLNNKKLYEVFYNNKNRMLKDKLDLNKWMIELFSSIQDK